MNVLLINPRNDDLYDPAYWPPLGLLYVAAALDSAGHKVSVVDMALDPLPLAGSYSPELIGVTCTTPNYLSVATIISICKQRWPGVPVVVGGPHVSIRPEDGARLGADVTVWGDGEEAILRIADGDLRPVQSCSVDVNRYPFPLRKAVSLHRYRAQELGGPSTSLITQRGCPYRCAYCCKWEGYRRVRYRAIDNVVQEVVQLREQGYRALRFFDDELNLNDERLLDLCGALRPLGVEWTCLVRANLLNSRQAQALHDAGCRMLQVGVESGSQKILEAVHKQCSVEENTRARRIAREHGLKFWAFFVVGLPGESAQTLEETRRWILENQPDEYSVYVFQPFPGTPIHESPAQYDIQFPHPLPYDRVALGIRGTEARPLQCLVRTSSLSSEEIVAARDYLNTDVRRELGRP